MHKIVVNKQGKFFSTLSNFKNLILIDIPYLRPKDPSISLGSAVILANLKQKKIPYVQKVYPINDVEFNYSNIISYIMINANKHTYTAFGTYVWSDYAIQQILNLLKEQNYPGKIILGGPQISYQINQLEKIYPFVDIFICGYAEEALTAFMSSSELHPQIKGVNYKGQDNRTLASIECMPLLPSPFLYDIIQPRNGFGFIRWETKRGCPFSCSYCKHNAGEQNKTMEFAKSRIIQEIQWIIEKNICDIAITDPTFNFGVGYIDTIEQLINAQYSGKISFQCRVELCNEDFLSRIETLNSHAEVTLEFGIQTIHEEEQRIINRLTNMQAVANLLDLIIKEYGINTELSIIYGLPNQTLASFQETVDFCNNYETHVKAYPLMLLPGTELYAQKTELGLVESTQLHHSDCIFGLPYVIGCSTFDYKDWQEMNMISKLLSNANALCVNNHKTNNKINKNVEKNDTTRNTRSKVASKGTLFEYRPTLLDSEISDVENEEDTYGHAPVK